MASCLVYPGFDRTRQQRPAPAPAVNQHAPCSYAHGHPHRRTRVTAKRLRALLAVGYAEAHHDLQTGKEKPGWVARIDRDERNRAD